MCYASISSKCRGCDGVDVESTEEEEEEDEEAAVPVHQKNKGNGTRGSESDNDGEDKEEDEDEEEEEGEEGAARPKASTKKRSRVCSQSERVLMISARAEVIGKTFAPKKVRGSKSPIWDFFTKIADKDGNISAASCICGVQLAFQVGWGTGHLTRHTNKCSIVLRSKARTIMSLDTGEGELLSKTAGV